MATHGSTAVGTSAVQITETSTPLIRGVQVRADSANTNKIYIGLANTVTAASASTTDGYQLAAGESLFISPAIADNLTDLWFIAGASSQKIFWLAY